MTTLRDVEVAMERLSKAEGISSKYLTVSVIVTAILYLAQCVKDKE